MTPQRLARARLSTHPRPATRDEYEPACEEIMAGLQRLPGAVAVYRTGSVSVPGISDIDLIAVVEDGGPVPSIWSGLSDRTRYLAMHTPFLADTEAFRRHRWFAFVEPLELVWGSAVDVESRPVPEQSEPLLAAEGLVTRFLRLSKASATGRLKVRPTLCTLHSLRHDLRLAGLDRADAPGAWAMVDEVSDLRRAWFQRDGIPALRRVLARALPALSESLRALGTRLDGVGDSHSVRVAMAHPWENVTVVPSAEGVPSVQDGPWGALLSLGGRWRRGGELGWRLSRCSLRLPRSVMALLSGAGDPEDGAFYRERRRTVHRYREFMARSGAGYSALGAAMAFT